MDKHKAGLTTLIAALAVAPLAAPPVQAQAPAPAQVQRLYSEAEIDQMLAPIALYPDALLSQVLMAATYPLEVVLAARWSRANPGLKGETAVRAVQNEDWDPSVKSLVAFPQILQRMDERLDWTRSLGDAFLAQEPVVMARVQALRQRAMAAGSLRSDAQVQVAQQGQVIVVQPASPQLVYVPYYDPLIVYGPWWWPAYPPVAWAPWPGYVRAVPRPGISVGFWWGGPVAVSLNFFFGFVDWHTHHVSVAPVRPYYYRPPVVVHRPVVVERGRWQHDPYHRRGIEYRNAEFRQRFVAPPAARAPAPAPATVERRAAPQGERRSERERREPRDTDRRGDRFPDGRSQRGTPTPQPVVQNRVQTTVQTRATPAEHKRTAPMAQRQAREHGAHAPMPAAKAPQAQRVERQAQREERREERREQRRERREERIHGPG